MEMTVLLDRIVIAMVNPLATKLVQATMVIAVMMIWPSLIIMMIIRESKLSGLNCGKV